MSHAIDLSDLNLTDSIHIGELVTWGGFSMISRGTLLGDGTKVETALKTLLVRGSTGTLAAKERLRRHFYREVLLWRKLRHSNIVPLLGYIMAPDDSPILVSPWYTNGNVIKYIALNPNADRRALALDVLSGLGYLHSIPVAHGDLKGENVLIDFYGHASLCDFGMSQFIDEASRITGFTTTNANTGGTDRFMAPELLEDQPKSLATDMWALACLITQGIIPYGHITRRQAVITAIVSGDQPVQDNDVGMESDMWDCIKRCWITTPKDRPTALELRMRLAHIHDRMKRVFRKCNLAIENCVDETGRKRYLYLDTLLSGKRYSDRYGIIIRDPIPKSDIRKRSYGTNYKTVDVYPVTISDIRKRSNGTYYKTVDAYLQEWQQFFDNAKMCSLENSHAYNIAKELQRVFDTTSHRWNRPSGNR